MIQGQTSNLLNSKKFMKFEINKMTMSELHIWYSTVYGVIWMKLYIMTFLYTVYKLEFKIEISFTLYVVWWQLLNYYIENEKRE